MTTIERIEHGDPRLWTWLGPFLASRAVHRELGGALYSTAGVVWWVATNEDGDVVGFASLRTTRTAAWHDYTYVVPAARGRGVHALLAAARDAFIAERYPDLVERVATCSDRWHHYVERGWEVASERGSWVHGIRSRRASQEAT